MIKTGVPQRSILGPLLLIIYMNDIHMASNKCNAILYANDTNLISPLCAFNSSLSMKTSGLEHMSQQINYELANIREWLNVNKLSLNVSKTKFMIYHRTNIEHTVPEIKINSEGIDHNLMIFSRNTELITWYDMFPVFSRVVLMTAVSFVTKIS